ncbi:MAG TPA: hypothetical protein VK859_06980, partial [bacterium]|nr:hypothetical protein [bacterium]
AQGLARTLKHALGPNPLEGTSVDVTQINLSADPSDADLLQVKAYSEPFIPTSAPAVTGENAALAQALKDTKADPSDESLEHLQDFVTRYPSSRWVLSVELNRGLSLYSRGYFSKAIEAYQAAWAAGQNEKQKGWVSSTGSGNPEAQADRAVGALMQMYLRVGHRVEAQALWDAVKARRPEGLAARDFENSREALWHMKHIPGRSYICGPLALRSILESEKSSKAQDPVFQSCQSTDKGYSLDKVWEMSQQLGMGMQMAKRNPGAAVLVPAVVNWKVGHYAALVAKTEGAQGIVILSKDPTFHNDTLLTEKALDEEASGYFLVPSGALPQGWEAVGPQEASQVFGRGYSTELGAGGPSGGAGGDDCGGNPPPPPPPTTSCPTCNNPPGGCGASGSLPLTQSGPQTECNAFMPRASVDMRLVETVVRDMPLSYKPPFGPQVNLLLSYNQKSAQPLLYSNFGPDWSFNWQAYIQYSYSNGQASNFNLYNPGGGQESFSPGGNSLWTNSLLQAAQTFTSGGASGLPSVITREMEDGTVQTYGYAIQTGGMVTILLTRVTDAQGNAANINYDPYFRMASITDALGKATNFYYMDPLDTYKITQIQDPFGRTANFTYDN